MVKKKSPPKKKAPTKKKKKEGFNTDGILGDAIQALGVGLPF